ncbi:MAG: alkaline phosphatase [Holophagales bacterium]|nr:alkaline phosphatase [Holophagales bacterium]
MSTVDASFGTNGHTATMVPVFAFGPGAEAFAGLYDNTGIFDRIRAALGL